jgi:hypothetical protein
LKIHRQPTDPAYLGIVLRCGQDAVVTDEDLIAAIRATAVERGLPPPASESHVAGAERVIGYPIPPLLRRLYLEVADGGFGPHPSRGRFGVLGVNTPGTDEELITSAYDEGPWDLELVNVPHGLVRFYDWGCAMWSIVDFRDPSGPMWGADNGRLFREHMDLAEWLARAIDGSLNAPNSNDHPDSISITADVDKSRGSVTSVSSVRTVRSDR